MILRNLKSLIRRYPVAVVLNFTGLVAALEERCELLEGRYKDLFRMVLFLAKEARVLDPGLCERSMESLGKGD